MENKLQRYVNRSFLIVDDFQEFRNSLKGMVETMGARHIDLAHNGVEAIDQYSKSRHDIILLDYNLGDGMNGLQMLDELIYADILRHDTIVMLITGETSMEMVQGAIDMNLDDCLPKPFTKATLKTRLDRAYEKNALLRPVLELMNHKDYLKAVKACDVLLNTKTRIALQIYRLKAECFLRIGKPNSAMGIYNNILIKRELPWALMGRARCKVHCSFYFEAIGDLDKIIEAQPYAIAAYDQKAECLIAVGQYEKAYHVLQKAVTVSGASAHRQRNLAELADRYHAWDNALIARRKVISLSRHLSQKQPDDFFKLAQTLSRIHRSKKGPQSRRGGLCVEFGDGDRVAEHVVQPANGRRRGHGKTTVDQAQVVTVARPQHQPMLAEPHGPAIAIDRQMIDGEQLHRSARSAPAAGNGRVRASSITFPGRRTRCPSDR